MENNYYVYRWIRLDLNVPFYVGASNKANFARAYDTTRRTKEFKEVLTISKTRAEIILNDLNEYEATIKEAEFISFYGCIRLGGTLVNVKRNSPMTTEKTKKIISEALKCNKWNLGKKRTKEVKEKQSKVKKKDKNPFFNKKHSKESREKMSKSQKGRKDSKETKIKKSIARIGDKNPMYGKKHTQETIEKIKETCRLKKITKK